jgi:hypothetical protein
LQQVKIVGNMLPMENTETLERQAEARARELAGNTPLRPKRHVVRYNMLTGRARYPFKAMVLGDFFLLDGKDHALAARNALKTFLRKNPVRRFAIRLDSDSGYWICRRTT